MRVGTIRAVTSHAGHLLVAAPTLIDPNFWRTVVLIIHHDDDGALGLILNRPSLERVADHLEEWAPLVPDPGVVHFGGPVQPEVAIAVLAGEHGEPTGLAGVTLGDVSDAGIPDNVVARVFAGYSGWGSGQLEDEIGEGSWLIVEALPADPFDEPDEMWERVLRRQGGRLGLLASFPIDVSLN